MTCVFYDNIHKTLTRTKTYDAVVVAAAAYAAAEAIPKVPAQCSSQ